MALPPAITDLVDCQALRESAAMEEACEFGKARNFSLEKPDLEAMAKQAGAAAARSACATVSYGATEVAAQLGFDPCGAIAKMVTDYVFGAANKVVSGIKGVLGLKPSKKERVASLTGEYRDQIAQLLLATQHTQILMQQALDSVAQEAVDIYDLVLPEYRGSYTTLMAKQRLSAMGLPLVNEWVSLPMFSGPRFNQLVAPRPRTTGLLAPDIYRLVFRQTDDALRRYRLGSTTSTVVDTKGRSAKDVERAYEQAMGFYITMSFSQQDDFAEQWLQQLEVLGTLLVSYVGERAGARIRLEHAHEIEQLEVQAEKAARVRAFWEAAYREQELWRQRKFFADSIGLLVWGGGSYASYKQQWGWPGYLGAFAVGWVTGRLLRGKSPEERFAEAVAAKQQAQPPPVKTLQAPTRLYTF